MASLQVIQSQGQSQQRAPARAPVSPVGGVYMDILLLGKTGMGKSTTAHKLLTANEQNLTGTTQGDPQPVEGEGGQVMIEDLSVWRLSGGNNFEKVKERIKQILLQRSCGEGLPNSSYESSESVTSECELFANEKSRVRVLDVPGFNASNSLRQVVDRNIEGLATGAQSQFQANLGVLRQIVRIQAEKNLVFRRILYFLPCRGSLDRADSSIQSELQLLTYFFGMSIFDSMVAVTTHPYDFSKKGCFSQRSYDLTTDSLKKSFQLAFGNDAQAIPNIPLLYISLDQSGQEILNELRSKGVETPKGLQLRFQENACARCAMQYGAIKREKVVCFIHDDGRRTNIPYDESKCHPLIKPKYTTLQKIVGGVAYVLLLGIPYVAGAQWPGFSNSDEECPNCKRPPGSPGCMKVHLTYLENKLVDHTSELDEIIIHNPNALV